GGRSTLHAIPFRPSPFSSPADHSTGKLLRLFETPSVPTPRQHGQSSASAAASTLTAASPSAALARAPRNETRIAVAPIVLHVRIVRGSTLSRLRLFARESIGPAPTRSNGAVPRAFSGIGRKLGE